MERQSGKEGESILFPSGTKGNSIRFIIEPFFTSFYISLLEYSSSCPFLPLLLPVSLSPGILSIYLDFIFLHCVKSVSGLKTDQKS